MEQQILSRFTQLEKIGEGTYSNVFKAWDIEQNATVALKKIKIQSEYGLPQTCIREISVMQELSHPNILPITDILLEDNNVYIILPFYPSDLNQYFRKMVFEKRKLDAFQAKNIAFQMLSAIEYCHERAIVHRDLKPHNLLVKKDSYEDLQLCVADFGLCRALSLPIQPLSHEVETL